VTRPDPSRSQLQDEDALDELLHQALDELADGGELPAGLETKVQDELTRLYARIADDVCSALDALVRELEKPQQGDLPFRPPTPFPFDDPQHLVHERMRVTPRAFLPFPETLPTAIREVKAALVDEPARAWSLASAHVLLKQRLDLRLDDPLSLWLDERRDAFADAALPPEALTAAFELVDAVASAWLRAAFLRSVAHAPVTPRTQAAVARFRQRVLASAGPIERMRALCLDDPTLHTTARTLVTSIADPGRAADAFREILIEQATTAARERRASPLTPWRIALMIFVLALFVLLFVR
jgi:hypothetical protein